MQTMAEVFGSRQADLARGLSERLDGLGARIGHSLTDTSRATSASLTSLAERLAVIDRAQRGITELSAEMIQLKSILANKQARGAFGQGRMEAIVADALPPNGYAFQATLSTGVRPDCLVHLPDGAPRPRRRRQVSAGGVDGVSRGGERGGAGRRDAGVSPRRDPPRDRHPRQISPRRRDPRHRLPVRAVGIDLRGPARAFRRGGAAGAPGAGGDRLAVSARSRHPGGAVDRSATRRSARRRM